MIPRHTAEVMWGHKALSSVEYGVQNGFIVNANLTSGAGNAYNAVNAAILNRTHVSEKTIAPKVAHALYGIDGIVTGYTTSNNANSYASALNALYRQSKSFYMF